MCSESVLLFCPAISVDILVTQQWREKRFDASLTVELTNCL